MISIGRLEARDRAAWEELFAGYHAFYGRPNWPQENYDEAWSRFEQDDRIHALRAPSRAARRVIRTAAGGRAQGGGPGREQDRAGQVMPGSGRLHRVGPPRAGGEES